MLRLRLELRLVNRVVGFGLAVKLGLAVLALVVSL